MIRPPVLALVLAGCAAGPAAEPDPATRELVEDPARLHEIFFRWVASTDEYGKAHDLLTRESKAALGYEAFCLGLTQARNLVPDGFGHLVTGMKLHRISKPDGDEVAVRWCNPAMGYSRDLLLRAEKLGKYRLWKIALAREDLESMKDGLLAWYNHQKDVAGGQRLVYPPGWKYAPVGSCACTREEKKRKQP